MRACHLITDVIATQPGILYPHYQKCQISCDQANFCWQRQAGGIRHASELPQPRLPSAVIKRHQHSVIIIAALAASLHLLPGSSSFHDHHRFLHWLLHTQSVSALSADDPAFLGGGETGGWVGGGGIWGGGWEGGKRWMREKDGMDGEVCQIP